MCVPHGDHVHIAGVDVKGEVGTRAGRVGTVDGLYAPRSCDAHIA
jgi:hypothetical protein